MTPSSASDIDELALLLERAGIALPPERMADVAAEYALFREQLALVNGIFTGEDEPALVFVARMPVGRE